MARCRRGEVARADEVGVYHCVQRVVRRAALCGADAVTGLDLGHRRDWIRGRLEELAGAFAVEIAAFAVMDNHLHVVARIRPDLAAAWSDAEVAARWLAIFPGPADLGRPASEPSAPLAELAAIAGRPSPAESMILADPARLAEVRRRLADLSWFMRALAEPIARLVYRPRLPRPPVARSTGWPRLPRVAPSTPTPGGTVYPGGPVYPTVYRAAPSTVVFRPRLPFFRKPAPLSPTVSNCWAGYSRPLEGRASFADFGGGTKRLVRFGDGLYLQSR